MTREERGDVWLIEIENKKGIKYLSLVCYEVTSLNNITNHIFSTYYRKALIKTISLHEQIK